MEDENGEAYEAKAQKTYENIGDEHGAIEEAWFGLIFKTANRTFFRHCKGPGQFHRAFKQFSLTAPWAGHIENTTNLTHGAKLHQCLRMFFIS